ncbi:L-tyrosine:2-oxoglutarate aminotransferase [Dichomitus squalens]|uniref:L-tyrosine:2-oxoglutarate aminotransferase n=1 Tax=Dichomitus squalens TaxID=114155 RepID=A0A4Q9MAY4_9APHY|nr:L-tyrosine:2-oxoglutarate aminotransferase [Dichomitus squalens]
MGTPRFIDLTHHLAPETLARRVNPLKDLIRVAQQNPHLVSLANGDPHFSLYPVRRINIEIASVSSSDDPVSTWRTLGPSAPTQTLASVIDEDSGPLLRASLAYGHGAGLQQALDAITEINKVYHVAPAHVATMTLGNADAITKVFRMLGAPGDYFLADEFTFGPMPLAADAHGIKWVPVRIDSGGIIPEELERILSEWDIKRGRRPHVLYSTPCGQNPTGSTLNAERRKRIYELAQKFDFIIIEDDPYYFLQYDAPNTQSSVSESTKAFPTSFLSLDVDGRVIRIDSFSKVLAPGLRLGYITTAPQLVPHLINLIDFSTQNPSGFPQVLIAQLFGPTGWQLSGFDKWVRSLRLDYQRRRDHFLALFERDVQSTGFATADVPEAGMFFWVRVLVERHPRFQKIDPEPLPQSDALGRPKAVARTNAKALMDELFDACVAGGVLVCPASIFVLPTDGTFDSESIDDRSNFLRLTFAGSEETMSAGIPIFGKVLKQFFA